MAVMILQLSFAMILHPAMNNVYSKTYPNGSAKHAWRAGFREGVKMCPVMAQDH